MKTIFLFIYPRLFISDLLRGEYIKYLSSKYRVVVFLENPDDSYYKSDNITYIKFPLKINKFWTLFEILLRINLIRRFDHFVGIKYRHRRYGGEDWRKNLLKFASRILPRNFFSPRFFYWFEKIFVTDKKIFKQYIDKYNPSLVLTSGPGLYFMEGWAILCSKKFGIPTAAINFSWDNLTIYARSVRKTDYIICWNDIVKKEAQTIHKYKNDEVFVSGILRYDFLFRIRKNELGTREEFLKSKGLDPSKKTIFVATATDSDTDLHKKIINVVKDMNVNIYVRVHPLERMKTYEEFKGLNNVYMEYAGTVKQNNEERGWQTEMEKEDQINLKKILKFCDLHINRSSTITLDSLAFNLKLPIINLKFPTSVVPVVDYEHYKPIIDEGAVRLAHNTDEMVKYVKMYFDNPLLDMENRKKVFEMMIKFNDGLSYKRSVDFLEKMIKK